MIGWLALAGFALTIPAANWMIGSVGTTCSETCGKIADMLESPSATPASTGDR